MELNLDQRLLEKNIDKTRLELSRPYYDLFTQIREKGANGEICEAIEHLFGYQKTICELITSDINTEHAEEEDFVQIYSYLISAKQAVSELGERNDSTKKFHGKEIDFHSGIKSLLKQLINTYKTNISRYSDNEKDVLQLTNQFLQWIVKGAEKEYSENVPFKLKNKISILEKKITRKNTSNKPTQDQIVGNKELITQIDNSLKLLFLYDTKSKLHPHILRYNHYVQRILAIGNPGCGKSFTLEAMTNKAMELSEKYEKNIIIKNLSNDLKSKYYSESAHNIKHLFDEVNKGISLYILIADDLDTVIFGRSENEHSENISVFGELIRNIESVTSNNKGNYLLWATTNKPENLDSALLRRFQKRIIVKGPETIHDYVSLMKIKLRGYIEDELICLDDWNKIGTILYEHHVPGSLIADIASSISESIINISFPAEMYSLSAQKVSENLPGIYQQITEQQFLNEIDKQIAGYRCTS